MYFLANWQTAPIVHFPDQLVKRPWDLIPLTILLFISLPIVVKFNKVYPSYFIHSLLVAFIPATLEGLYIIFGSAQLYDNEFMIAMYLRILVFSTLLLGVCFDYIRAHQERKWAYGQLEVSVKQRDQAHLTKVHFIDNMSDQIRTSMNGVMGICNLLLKTDLDQNQRKLARIISQSSGNLLGIIGEIIDLSKVDYKTLDVEYILFDINKLLIQSIEVFQGIAKESQIRLHVNISQDVPSFVYGDQDKVRNIMISFLSDVMRCSKKGNVTVSMTGSQIEKDTWNYSIEIEYAGEGIHLRETPKEVLGFSIAREMAKKIGGKIDVKKKENKNWLIQVGLPFKVRKHLDVPKNLSEFLLGYKVLVVEPDDIERTKIADVIQAFGMECKAVKGPKEAEDLIKNGVGFDIFLINHFLPDLDAIRLVKLLRTYPESSSSSFVIMAGEGIEKLDKDKYELKKVIKKPVHPSDLFYVLSDIVYKENPLYVFKKGISQTYPEPSMAPLDVLVVEDDYITQYVIKNYLEHYGCTVEVVSGGEEVLEICGYKDFDCIFIDCCTPSMDNSKIVKELRQKKRSAYLIALTADAIPASKELCRQVGMDAELSKPIVNTELVAILQKVKEHQQCERSDV